MRRQKRGRGSFRKLAREQVSPGWEECCRGGDEKGEADRVA